MSNMLKDNRLPIGISVVALVVATMIGLVPVMQDRARETQTSDAGSAALEARIEAIEAAASAPTAAPVAAAADIPANATNARLRQEIDLITRGLANQTGRVSRLKSTVEGIVDENGQLMTPQRVNDEIALAKRGLSNLTRRINELNDQMAALETAAADIDRLEQQMSIANRAFARMKAAETEAAEDREQMRQLLSGIVTIANTAPAPAATAQTNGVPEVVEEPDVAKAPQISEERLDQLETALEEILNALRD